MSTWLTAILLSDQVIYVQFKVIICIVFTCNKAEFVFHFLKANPSTSMETAAGGDG